MGISVLLAGNLPGSQGRTPGLSTESGNISGLDFSALLASQLMVLPDAGKLPSLPAAPAEGNGLPVDIEAAPGGMLPQPPLKQDWAHGPENLLVSLPTPAASAPSVDKPEVTEQGGNLLTAGTAFVDVNLAAVGKQESQLPTEAEPTTPTMAPESAPASTTTGALEHHRVAEAAALSPLQEPPRIPAQQQGERSVITQPTLPATASATALAQEASKQPVLPQAVQVEVALKSKNMDTTLPPATRVAAPGTFAEALAGRVAVAVDGNGAPAIVAAESGNGQASLINSVGLPGEKGHAAGSALKDGSPAIQAPLHDPRWNQQLGDRVLWMARGEAQTAQISITPAHLGPIQISISLQGDQMTAHFISAHQEVRQALEDAMPRLREMLSGAGINLGQANVGAQQQQRDTRAQFAAAVPSAGEEAILPGDASWNTLPAQPLQRGRGMIDLFA
jgi:flagellar hook-length control protein FliK